ncbi:MAG TPA: phosphatase PAP2 family protein [Bryobacteraceae bacterium]|jgi:membrane-associated phospholipid phosphatase|nr:phosphatase PAP2 family protein [Bryobacteraceae bacterium]
MPALRGSEWVLLGYFGWAAAIAPWFHDRPRLHAQPVFVLAAVACFLLALAKAETTRYQRAINMVRDWIPIPLTLLAFREMEWFVPVVYNSGYEHSWIRLDRVLLDQYCFKSAIESLGPLLPTYLELCYLLVYGVGTFCVIVLWLKDHRPRVDRFYVILLTGTLISYALFPFFPSRPPRIAFPDVAAPLANNVLRHFNLFLLRSATIHTGVFPSAHVSSAFAAAWAMFLVMPDRKRFGWGLSIYAFSVAAATVYGRYHYAVDALAGFAISLIAGAVGVLLSRRDSAQNRRLPLADSHLVA